jgi:GT2 family glycosyltransferase
MSQVLKAVSDVAERIDLMDRPAVGGDLGLHVVVLIVAFNGREYLPECLESVLASDDGLIRRRVVVVDNASTDGTAAWLAEKYADVLVVRSEANLGFAGGNNLGWSRVNELYPDVDFVALLNQDTIVADGWLRALVDYLYDHPTAGAAQPRIVLHPRTDLLNTAGNVSHFLGFGYTSGYREPDNGNYRAVRRIDFASGAAALVRAAPLRAAGLFNERMFLYLEDAELGWKLRQLGYETVFVPQSVAYHKYKFHGPFRAYYYLERNRWMLLACYYKMATLLLLAPAMVMMEMGQIVFALQHGLLDQKLRACGYFLNRRNLAAMLRCRRAAQRHRIVGDREFMGCFSGTINNPELDSALLRRVGNPILGLYWRFVRRLIVW